MTMLFLPKFLAIAIHIIKGASRYGGAAKLAASMLTESLISMAVAPIMMLYHSRFVFLTLIGKKVRWNAQVRTDDGIGLRDAIRSHGVQTLIGIVVTGALAYYSPELLAWASPLLVGLVCAIPLGQLMASPRVGGRLAKLGLLINPRRNIAATIAAPPQCACPQVRSDRHRVASESIIVRRSPAGSHVVSTASQPTDRQSITA